MFIKNSGSLTSAIKFCEAISKMRMNDPCFILKDIDEIRTLWKLIRVCSLSAQRHCDWLCPRSHTPDNRNGRNARKFYK